MKSARERFIASAHRKIWHDITGTSAFEAAADTALLALTQSFGEAKDATESAAINYRIEGARAFLSILSNLTEPIPVPRRINDNLNHKA